jgi:hypothetical protein
METEDIKSALAGQTNNWDSFTLLKSIAARVNQRDTHNEGRDLVIRCLAFIEKFNAPEKQVLFALVRSVGLYPYMTEHLESSDVLDRLAYELHRADKLEDNIVFHSLQSKIYNQLIAGRNVVLSASTSAGKSLVIDALIASGKYRSLVVVVPTLALIDEIRRRLIKRFREKCAIITHPSQVANLERINVYVLTQERVLTRDDLDDVQLVIVDEFYKVNLASEGETERAVDLNLAFHRLVRNGAQFYLLGPHVHSIRGLEKYEIFFIPSEFSTVAVDVINYGLPMKGDNRKHKLLELLGEVEGSTIVYCQSPSSATDVATFLAESGKFEECPETGDAVDWMVKNYHTDWVVTKALRCGIGIHHGGVPRALQQYFIRLFNDRVIKVLVCTSTIIEGVNTVAQNVIVYDRRKNQTLLDHFTYKNIEGRAGRMKQYFIGKVFVLENPPDDETFDVDFPIGLQSSQTPLSLLLDLEESDLSSGSADRLRQAFAQSTLSAETLRANRHMPIEQQEALAKRIRDGGVNYHNLAWTGVPTGPQLQEVCELAWDFGNQDAYRKNGVFAGGNISWSLNQLRMGNNIRGYLEAELKTPWGDETSSDIIEKALKLIRNVVCHRFPKDLMAIDAIQRDVYSKMGKTPGDYSLFAEQTENLYISPALYALDEYGIPLQTAQALSDGLLPADTLNQVLSKLRTLDLSGYTLSKFEIDVLEDVRKSVFV